MKPNPVHSVQRYGFLRRRVRPLQGYDIGNTLVAKGWNEPEERSALSSSTAAKKPRKGTKGVIDTSKKVFTTTTTRSIDCFADLNCDEEIFYIKSYNTSVMYNMMYEMSGAGMLDMLRHWTPEIAEYNYDQNDPTGLALGLHQTLTHLFGNFPASINTAEQLTTRSHQDTFGIFTAVNPQELELKGWDDHRPVGGDVKFWVLGQQSPVCVDDNTPVSVVPLGPSSCVWKWKKLLPWNWFSEKSYFAADAHVNWVGVEIYPGSSSKQGECIWSTSQDVDCGVQDQKDKYSCMHSGEADGTALAYAHAELCNLAVDLQLCRVTGGANAASLFASLTELLFDSGSLVLPEANWQSTIGQTLTIVVRLNCDSYAKVWSDDGAYEEADIAGAALVQEFPAYCYGRGRWVLTGVNDYQTQNGAEETRSQPAPQPAPQPAQPTPRPNNPPPKLY